MSVTCKICGDLEYVVKGKIRVPCKCARIKKLKAYFPYVDLNKVSPSAAQVAIKQCKDYPINKNLFLQTNLPEETLNLILLFYLLKLGSPSYTIMNSYELVEIYLEKHPAYKSYLEINYDCLVILHGYSEMENKRSEELLLQLLDNYRRMNKFVVFATRVSILQGSALSRYVTDNAWNKRSVTIEKMTGVYLK